MIIDSLAADSIYQTLAAFYYLLTEPGESMNNYVHKEEMAALQRAPLVASVKSLFVASLAFVFHLI